MLRHELRCDDGKLCESGFSDWSRIAATALTLCTDVAHVGVANRFVERTTTLSKTSAWTLVSSFHEYRSPCGKKLEKIVAKCVFNFYQVAGRLALTDLAMSNCLLYGIVPLSAVVIKKHHHWNTCVDRNRNRKRSRSFNDYIVRHVDNTSVLRKPIENT